MEMIPPALKNKLTLAIAGGAVAIAGVTISWFEGARYEPCQDVGGVWTVCEGITGSAVVPGKTYSKAECAALKSVEIQKANAAVNKYVLVQITETERAALIDFIYNVGAGNFARSTLLRKLNSNDHVGACNEYKRWVYANGQKYKGLENRREVSEWLCKK